MIDVEELCGGGIFSILFDGFVNNYKGPAGYIGFFNEIGILYKGGVSGTPSQYLICDEHKFFKFLLKA